MSEAIGQLFPGIIIAQNNCPISSYALREFLCIVALLSLSLLGRKEICLQEFKIIKEFFIMSRSLDGVPMTQGLAF